MLGSESVVHAHDDGWNLYGELFTQRFVGIDAADAPAAAMKEHHDGEWCGDVGPVQPHLDVSGGPGDTAVLCGWWVLRAQPQAADEAVGVPHLLRCLLERRRPTHVGQPVEEFAQSGVKGHRVHLLVLVCSESVRRR
jgi:hypothetical protein